MVATTASTSSSRLSSSVTLLAVASCGDPLFLSVSQAHTLANSKNQPALEAAHFSVGLSLTPASFASPPHEREEKMSPGQ